MQFDKLEIERDGIRDDRIKGRIRFISSNTDWLNFKLDEKTIAEIMQLILPIIERVHKEQLDIVRQEFLTMVEKNNGTNRKRKMS